MSYILDALRKAERERHRGHVPTLPAASQAPSVTSSSLKYLYAVIALLILSAGVLIGVWQPFRATPTPVADLPAAPVDAPTPVVAAVAPTAPHPSSAPIAPARAPAAVPTAPAPVVVRPAEAPASAPVVVPPAAPVPAANQAVSDEIRPLADLPAAIKQEIPAMTVLFHAYSSTPSQRLVQVNNKPLHEGDSLQPGLKLEQITADGMVFSYKGYRFSTGVK